jgi:peptidoglycan/LPS O-acetylase OafA/YrhL
MGLPSKYMHLDALRGIAILGVVVCHLAYYWGNVVPLPLETPMIGVNALDLLTYGAYGVSLFFLLSGYLLFGTEGARAKRGGYNVRGYATRRVLRILPAYYVSILVVVLMWPSTPSVWDVVSHALFLYGLSSDTLRTLDGVYWSLIPEAVFYCLLPFIVLKLGEARVRLVLLIALAGVSFATRAYLTVLYPGGVALGEPGFGNAWFLYCLPFNHLYLFVAGTLGGDIVRAIPSRFRRPVAVVLLVTSVAFFVLYPYLGPNYWHSLQSPWGMLVNLSVFAFFLSILLFVQTTSESLPGRRLKSVAVAALAFVGTISYSAFLFHITVIRLVSTSFLTVFLRSHAPAWGLAETWAAFITYLALMLTAIGVVSFVVYRCVEAPFLRLKPK